LPFSCGPGPASTALDSAGFAAGVSLFWSDTFSLCLVSLLG